MKERQTMLGNVSQYMGTLETRTSGLVAETKGKR